MGRWSCTVLIEADDRHVAEVLVARLRDTAEGAAVSVSPLMSEAEAAR